MLVYRSGILVLIDPDGKNEKAVSTEREREHYHPYGVRLSPDGKHLAVQVVGPLPPDDGTREAKPRQLDAPRPRDRREGTGNQPGRRVPDVRVVAGWDRDRLHARSATDRGRRDCHLPRTTP